MKKTSIVLSILCLFIIASNLPPLRFFYKENDCMFANGDGRFTYAELNSEGDNFDECKDKFKGFKKMKIGDTLLYRLTPMNIFHYWDYGKYLFLDKYKIPYRPWKEIESKRGPLINRSGFQHF